jgi:hypothetical protein
MKQDEMDGAFRVVHVRERKRRVDKDNRPSTLRSVTETLRSSVTLTLIA